MHNIHYITCAENANRKAIMAEIAEHASQDGDGYSSRMTWHDNTKPFESEEKARAFIDAVDNGWYDDHAVRFIDYSGATETAKMKEYEAKVAELVKGEREYQQAHSVKTFQAEFIGCKSCGSKLSKKHLMGSICPLCRADLRSPTTLAKIKWYQDKITEYRQRIEAEKRKQKSKAKIKWLVKYEYHS